MSDASNDASSSSTSPVRTRRLTTKQERNVVNFVEDKFLEITRSYKKRSHPSTTLPSLRSYLDATHPLLSVILQIPPIGSQASLRTALLLRLSGEFLGSVPGYTPDPEALPTLLEWLDDLDKGWLAVLRSQAWDADAREGVDITMAADPLVQNDNGEDAHNAPNNVNLMPVNQTDRTRLRSILMVGTSRLEEWLSEGLHVDGTEDLESALEKLGLQQSFDDLFLRALSEMGDLGDAAQTEMEMTVCR